jgi:hypothetical protein
MNKKLQEKTLKEMKESRNEDSIRLRKEAEELIEQCNNDVLIINETRKKLQDQINALNVKAIKTEGALHILKILLESK